jgi:hypothetical protein
MWFAGPALWAVVLACVALGPAANQQVWPFDSAVGSMVILLVPYAALAVWTSRPSVPVQAPAGDSRGS